MSPTLDKQFIQEAMQIEGIDKQKIDAVMLYLTMMAPAIEQPVLVGLDDHDDSNNGYERRSGKERRRGKP